MRAMCVKMSGVKVCKYTKVSVCIVCEGIDVCCMSVYLKYI